MTQEFEQSTEVAAAETPEAKKTKKATVYTEVTLEDGRKVKFAGTRKL